MYTVKLSVDCQETFHSFYFYHLDVAEKVADLLNNQGCHAHVESTQGQRVFNPIEENPDCEAIMESMLDTIGLDRED